MAALPGQVPSTDASLDCPGSAAENDDPRECARRYRALATALTDGIAVTVDGRIVASCDRLARLFGFDESAHILGKTLGELCPNCHAVDERATADGPLETRGRKSDGSLFPVEIVECPVRCGGRSARILGFRDISNRKRLEEQLSAAQGAETIAALAGGVAHDVNNLLTAIFGQVSLARGELPPRHPALAPLEEIESAAQAAAAVVRAIPALTRPRIAAIAPIELSRIVASTGRLIGKVLPATVRVRVEAPPDTPLWVMGDETQVQHLLLNLAVRARESLRGGGELALRAAALSTSEARDAGFATGRAASAARIVVTHSPLPDAADPARAEREPSAAPAPGIGVLRDVVREMGGRIQVDSQAAEGAQFTILLPGAVPEAIEPGTARSPLPAGDGEWILVAEDYDLIRGLMASTLTSCGYEVAQAGDGQRLMELYEANESRCRLLLIDLDLPRRSGLDCLKAIRAAGAQPPVILMTGDASSAIDDLCDERTFLLRKPFSMANLAKVVSRVLKKPGEMEPPL